MSRVWSRRLRPWGLAAALALLQVDSTSGGSLTIPVDGSEKMRVDSRRRVGISDMGSCETRAMLVRH
jgi:hypothetical protein